MEQIRQRMCVLFTLLTTRMVCANEDKAAVAAQHGLKIATHHARLVTGRKVEDVAGWTVASFAISAAPRAPPKPMK